MRFKTQLEKSSRRCIVATKEWIQHGRRQEGIKGMVEMVEMVEMARMAVLTNCRVQPVWQK